MAISRETKEAQVKQLSEDFDRSKLTVLFNYKGLTVAEAQELRKLLKEQSSGMRVIKNSLIKLAATNSKNLKKVDPGIFNGPVALAFGYDDEVAPAQVLANYAKTHQVLELLGAVDQEGTVMDGVQVNTLASLPGKQQLRGHVVGTLAAPVSGFVTVLRANISGLVHVLNAYAKAKG